MRQLFCEIADAPSEDRERIFAERGTTPDVRAEIESLLAYDSMAGEPLVSRVAAAAEAVLRSSPGPAACGPYRLVRLLGSGGMGSVYLAERRDGEIEQRVAIKLLRADADRPEWRERFLRERQILAYLNHPAIARLLDAGHTDDGRPYLVMEYIDGVAIDAHDQTADPLSKLKLFLHVCDGVSHAHRHLIIHRDLKPSNILVDSSGQPKLLDFGIAKLLEVSPDRTQTVERILTPNYASPEQLRGDVQTTATDVYSLGAVLHKLLYGRSPRERATPAGRATSEARIPRDADYILRKALHEEPADRYPSVDALADDIRAFLESRPVKARAAGRLYHARKFLRRHRVAVAAGAITVVSIAAGLLAANQQHRVAQRRLEHVRQLTGSVLMFDRVISGQQSTAKARQEIAARSKQSLEVLAAAAGTDPALALEVGEAYSILARVQGISVDATPAGFAQAEESLHRAYGLVAPVLDADPGRRKALLVSARIGHDRMLLEASRRRSSEALTQAGIALGHLERLRTLGEFSGSEGETVSEIYHNIAVTERNLHRTGDAVRSARIAIEVARPIPGAWEWMGRAQSVLADLLRLQGDLDGALAAIRAARRTLEHADFPSETARRSAWLTVYVREGRILGNELGLNRTAEAVTVLQKAFRLLEDWTRNEREDAWSRLLFGPVGGQLAGVLVAADPQASLRIYDLALVRLREVQGNMEARRAEAEILAGSAAPLQRLNRAAEAKDRIDLAFRLLRHTGDYPAERIATDDAACTALRALGDYHAAAGRPQQAAAVYEDLLARIASKPSPVDDLRHALALSEIYRSLTALHGRNGQHGRKAALERHRLELLRHWDRELPGNSVIRRHRDL